MFMNKVMRSLLVVLSMTLLAAVFAQGQASLTDNYTPVAIKLVDPHPNLPTQMLVQDINNVGVIIGHLGDEHNGTGFVRSKSGQYTEFLFPGPCDGAPPCTYPQGVNDRGQIVGFTLPISPVPAAQSFLREPDGSTKILPAAPANSSPMANSINNRGDIVGSYANITPGVHGFLLRNQNYTAIDFPGTERTVCTGINNNGLITGFYQEKNGGVHGFLWSRGNFIATFQILDANGMQDTFPAGINDQGQVSGNFGAFRLGAFVRNLDGTVKIIDLATLLKPIGGSGGILTGINNQGDLVGSFGPGLSVTFGDIFGFLIPHGAGNPR